jgi:hypothetical protein
LRLRIYPGQVLTTHGKADERIHQAPDLTITNKPLEKEKNTLKRSIKDSGHFIASIYDKNGVEVD